MADDRRPRGERRVGDATQARIDDMATGWKKPKPSEGSADGAEAGNLGSSPARRKAPSVPPPPPGARKRPTSPPSVPPPLPPQARRKAAPSSQPPAAPKASGTPTSTPSHPSGPAHARTIPRRKGASEPIPPRSAASPPPAIEKPLRKPVITSSEMTSTSGAIGESGSVKLPLGVNDSSSSRRRADDKDATVIPSGEESAALQLATEFRAPAALPRTAGLWGDMLYVGTVFFGRRRLRVELAETELEIEAEKRSRDKELTELARLLISDPDVDLPIIEQAREKLVELEEARSRKAGAAAAAEQAIGAILRERDRVKSERESAVLEIERQIADLEAKLEPLVERRVEIGKRARDVVEQVERYDARIAEEEAALETASLEDAAAGEASLAGLRAEREVAASRQPALATELADVEPFIKELKTEKGELAKKMSKLRRAEDESVVRSEEKVTAARAHKLVVDRAAADRTREQNELLRELGESLYHDPPPSLVHLAKPLEERFATVKRLKEKAIEAREKIESVERLPLVRGAGLWLLVLAAIGGIAFLVLKFV